MGRRLLAASIAVWDRPQGEAEGNSWTNVAVRESIDCSEVTDPTLALVREEKDLIDLRQESVAQPIASESEELFCV